MFVEGQCIFNIDIIWMIFCDSPNEFEWSEGIEAKAAIFSEDVWSFISQCVTDCFGVSFFLCAVCIDEKYIFAIWGIVFRKFQNSLFEF